MPCTTINYNDIPVITTIAPEPESDLLVIVDGVPKRMSVQNFKVWLGVITVGGEYASHEAAGTGGVLIGNYFTASVGNSMGAIPGAVIKRMF